MLVLCRFIAKNNIYNTATDPIWKYTEWGWSVMLVWLYNYITIWNINSYNLSVLSVWIERLQKCCRYKISLEPEGRYHCRAFSRDVMPSSKMAASIPTAINIHLCKHLSALLCVMVSPWLLHSLLKRMMSAVRAWCAWLPWISRSVCAIRRPCWRTSAWRQWKRFFQWCPVKQSPLRQRPSCYQRNMVDQS